MSVTKRGQPHLVTNLKLNLFFPNSKLFWLSTEVSFQIQNNTDFLSAEPLARGGPGVPLKFRVLEIALSN